MKARRSPARRNAFRRALPAFLAATALGCVSATALAARPPAQVDLSVRLIAPATVNIAQATSYTVTVSNLSQQSSGDISVQVRFALSNTSPQVFILGAVTGLDPRCSLGDNMLNCRLAPLGRNGSTSFNYSYTAPVSTKPLQMTASVSATTADPALGNNSATVLPSLVYPSLPITQSGINVRACTGTALTSFYECTQFPSSMMGFSALLKADQSIELVQPGYSGSWSQNAAKTSLSMVLYEDQGQGPVQVSTFSGWAINGARCFHGLATHTQSPNYVSPYEVCLP